MNIFIKYYSNSDKTDSPIVPSGISTPKLSAIVAPITANVSRPSIFPFCSMEGEYAMNGTYSLV